MKNKLIALLTAFVMMLTPAFAEETVQTDTALTETVQTEVTETVENPESTDSEEAEETEETEETEVPRALSVFQQELVIRNYAHTLADNYYYGADDANLLFNAICATIENGGVFDIDVALSAMVTALGDTYSEYYSPESFEQQTSYFGAEFFGIGVTLSVLHGGTVVENVYSGSSAEMAGICAGDQIISVDGTDTSNMEPSATRELIVGEEGTFVEIGVLRGEETLLFRAVRQKVTLSHSDMTMLDGNIAYINVESFTASLPEEFDEYIATMKAQNVTKLIIDLRDNGGGDLDAAIEVAQKLIPAGIIGTLKYKDETRNQTLYSENLNAPSFKTLVLVNENTASASEFLAMALQSRGKAKLLGVSTFGKGCMQALVQTPTGSGLKFTIGEFYSPKDERIQSVGLEPDIEVENIVTPVDVEQFEKLDLLNLDSAATKLGIEQRLNALRLLDDIEVDGEYNDDTANAVRVFQQYKGIDVNGEIDFYTAMYINDYEYDMDKVTDVQMQEALKYFE